MIYRYLIKLKRHHAILSNNFGRRTTHDLHSALGFFCKTILPRKCHPKFICVWRRCYSHNESWFYMRAKKNCTRHGYSLGCASFARALSTPSCHLRGGVPARTLVPVLDTPCRKREGCRACHACLTEASHVFDFHARIGLHQLAV